jgi:UDP-N-acetylglucosamine acyltransferase
MGNLNLKYLKIGKMSNYIPYEGLPIEELRKVMEERYKWWSDGYHPEYTINMNEYEPETENFIHSTAIIGPNVSLGKGNYIGPYCIIGYPAEHKAHWDNPVGKVRIGDNCRITGHVTIDASTGEFPTELGDNVWMLKHSHVGHDAYIGSDVTISCGAKVGGHAKVLAGSNIGLNACIHQWVTVPEHCMIGMNAAVTKKLQMEPFRKYAGVPAKDIGSNKKQ